MKTFKQLLDEVAQPRGGDEKAFKAKHVIEVIPYPVEGSEEQFTSKKTKKFVNRADYKPGEDAEFYEGLDPYGAEDKDVDNDKDIDSEDKQYHFRRVQERRRKIIDEDKLAVKDGNLVFKNGYYVTNSRNELVNEEPIKDSSTALEMAENEERRTSKPHIVHFVKNGAVLRRWLWSNKGRIWAPHDVENERPNFKRSMEEDLEVTEPSGGEFGDKEHSHVAYKKLNLRKKYAKPLRDMLRGEE